MTKKGLGDHMTYFPKSLLAKNLGHGKMGLVIEYIEEAAKKSPCLCCFTLLFDVWLALSSKQPHTIFTYRANQGMIAY